ncbi:MAG: hypothetical protein LC104_17190, partial [Bacteroidales bacterium]|nr:hypothetical protein [Bacteroidales bacterium]
MYQFAPDPPALTGLGDVDWCAVTHAHGPATDVPALLRAAVSDDPDHRDFAWDLLFETVWHQGTVYPASATVVPFLYQLLEADEVPDRSMAALMCASIADGHSGLACHATTSQSVAIFERIAAEKGSTLAAELARELADVAVARQAVGTRLDLLYEYLRHPEPHIRASVAAAIDHYPEIAARLLPDLEVAVRDEPEEYIQAILRRVIEHAEPGAAADPASWLDWVSCLGGPVRWGCPGGAA